MARKAPAGAPWAPAPYQLADIGAIQAMAKGEAEPHQQVRALKWIVEDVCRTYDLSFRPDSERDTAFAEGLRHAGLQIVKATKINTKLLRKDHAPRPKPSTEQPGT
ncbi:MAG TPA: hypothetical protein ENH55_13235 [Aurantimonas coralicida]|uniref:Uncharacterized protein n=2 Tax=root TaxID=1 RepID=A0A9C9ND98_9HYPH|nr:hypothetical protein [Aurantimonas coralicida]HET99676.1 hypothetical protein [Aurantimonas coralicida]